MLLLQQTMNLLHFLAVFTHEKISKCSRHMDSSACTQHYTWIDEPCEWCPLNKKCYEKCSTDNICTNKSASFLSDCKKINAQNYSYNVDEAYKLAKFSAVAYSDEPMKCLNKLFPGSDYMLFYVYFKKCDNYLFKYKNKCLAFATFSHRNREIIVAYRGTRGMKQIADEVLTSLGTSPVSTAIGGKVERYFYNVHEKSYYHIKHMIKDLIHWYPNYTVKLTGHSLGGAVASISSAMLVKEKILRPDQLLLYTFGMPRAGNKEYAHAHSKLVPNSWRVVRDGDQITKLPSCKFGLCLFRKPHHHGKQVLYSGSKMEKNSEHIVCNENDATHSECKEQKRRKRNLIKNLSKRHRVYFDIPMGTYCRDHVLQETADQN